MKSQKLRNVQSLLSLAAVFVLSTACTTTQMPDVSPEGLIKVDSKRVDTIYVAPGGSLAQYKKIALIEPEISFRSGWLSDTNSGRMMNRVSNKDMEEMIKVGKVLLVEEFAKELKKGGWDLVDEFGPDVLAVRPSIIKLDVFAPDPDGMGDLWSHTYTRGSGEATLMLELYDSSSSALLVRAYDRKTNENDGYSWRFSRTQSSNINDARNAFNSWASMFADGLNKAKDTTFPDAPPVEE